jgi:hypothetical protein
LNEQIAAVSRLAKADLMFGAMLRASAAPNQEALEALVEDARDKTKRLREIESGSGGHAELTGGFSFTATDGFRSADRDRGDQASLELPEPIRTLTSWLGDRLDIDVAEIDLHRLERVGAVAASAGGSAAPTESTPGMPSVSVAAKAAGHAHDREAVYKNELLRHVEQVHGQKAGMFGELALRRFHDEAHRAAARLDEIPGAEGETRAGPVDAAEAVAAPATSSTQAAAATSAKQSSNEPTIEILPPGSVPEPVQEALPERNGKSKGPARRPAATEPAGVPDIEPAVQPAATSEREPEATSLAAAAAEAAESVGELPAAEPAMAEAPEEATPQPRAKPKPRAKPRPAVKTPEPKPEPKPAQQREVVVVPNSPAGLEMAAPGPTEASAPERAAAAASAKQSSSHSYPPPLAAHTHDSPIWGHDDLLRHVEIIHGVPVGNMEPDALQSIHDATHAGD